jgi:hypothetical protein
MMKVVLALVLLAAVALSPGCTTHPRMSLPSMPETSAGVAGDDSTDVRADRMLIWKAQLRVQVWNVPDAVSQAISLAEADGGFAEQKSDSGEGSARVTLRVPAKAFTASVANLEALGTVTHRDIQGEDVTEQYIDVEARLRNKVVLRDRLKQLLDKASDVKDILAIETELSRVQGDIDSMEGRVKALKGWVDYATITLDLDRKPLLGPLGYLFKGIWWGGKKLFIIRG